jgi:hypothetical protein
MSGLLAGQPASNVERRFAQPATGRHYTRQAVPDYSMRANGDDVTMNDVYPSTEMALARESMSPTKSPSKHVSFELLLLPQSPQHRARLPMRVNIFPHDTTDSIITTVKNFYGLYEGRGVAFEDRHGNTLIARYENFTHNMVVYVRLTEETEPEEYSDAPRHSLSPRRPRLDEAFQMLPPTLNHHQASRGDVRIAARQSHSPAPGRGRRSASASTNTKSRTRPALKSRGTSSHGSFADLNGDAANYSDSDGGNASVTSSRRGKKEQVASADISVDNIVEGGRRKRAKFDSSVSFSHHLAHCVHSLMYSSHVGTSPFRSSPSPDDCIPIFGLSTETHQQPEWSFALLSQQPSDFCVFLSTSVTTKCWSRRSLVFGWLGHAILDFEWAGAGVKGSHTWLRSVRSPSSIRLWWSHPANA